LEYYYENKDVAAEQGRNGRKYFEDHFTLQRACKDYYELLKSLN
jgi:hypothetical protein